MLGNNKFKIECRVDLSGERFKSLVLFYLPLIEKDALALYEYLLIKGSSMSFCEISDILNTLFYSLDTFETALKKLNEYRLLITYRYKEEDKYLFVLKEPLKREEFIKNEIFVRCLILKTSGQYYYSLLGDIKEENNHSELENISSTLSPEVLNSWSKEDETYLKQKKNSTYDYDSLFDINSFINGCSTTLFPLQYRTQENIKEVALLADLYNISEDQMRKFFAQMLNDSKPFDLKELRRKCELNRSEYKKVQENKYDVPCELFMMNKANGIEISSFDKKILYNLANDYKLKVEVINVLIEHALKTCDNQLYERFINPIAANFKRNNIDTAQKALDLLNKPRNKTASKDIGMPEYKTVKHEEVDLAALYKRIQDGNK